MLQAPEGPYFASQSSFGEQATRLNKSYAFVNGLTGSVAASSGSVPAICSLGVL